jgi:hypothetical protein
MPIHNNNLFQKRRYVMKKLVLLVLVLGVVFGGASTVFADVPAPGGPFNTAFTVQNLGGADANCEFSFYDASGGAAYSSGTLPAIPPGSSLFVYVPNLSVADGMYSAVVSCDEDVAAVVNFSDDDSGASHSGIAGGDVAQTFYAPGAYDDYYDFYSDIVVQNASSGSVDITVSIYAPGSSSPVATQTATGVPANASRSFEQEGLAGLSSGVAYSAKIEATGAVATIVNIYGGVGTAVDNQLYSYNPVASGSTVAYAPVIMNAYYGYNTSLVIQNMGVGDTNYTVTYGTGHTQTGTIAAGASAELYTPASGLPAGTSTGAKVESSSEDIVVLVNESNDKSRAASYIGFASGSTTVSAPIVMKRYYEYNTSVTCQNIGTASTVMSISYGGISGTTSSPSIPINGTHMFYQPTESLLPDGFNGSATITAGQPIVCVVNEDQNEAPEVNQVMDKLYAYEGVAQ